MSFLKMKFPYWKLYLSCMFVCFSSVSVGNIWFYPSLAFPDINVGNYEFKLSTNMISWYASFSTLFAMPGSAFAALFMDKYGRKFTLMMASLPMSIGWLLMICSFNLIVFGIGRALTGFSSGMITSAATVYFSEISPKQLRGNFASLFGCFVSSGLFYINAVGVASNWKWMIVGGLVVNFIAVLTSFFMYETPRWLISKGQVTAAAEVIEKLWNIAEVDDVNKEIRDIDASIKSTPKVAIAKGLIELIKKPLWMPFGIAQLLMVFQMLTGALYINNYTLNIFEDISLNVQTNNFLFRNPKYQILLVTLGYPISGFLSIFFVDRFGRKFLLTTSAAMITVALSSIGAYYYIQLIDPILAVSYLFWLPLTCLIMFVFGYGFGFGAVPFIIASEIFPMHVRGLANSFSSFTHNLTGFIVLKVFPVITVVPNYGIFWIYAGITFVSIIFIIICIPETKGHSLEEIQTFWSPHKPVLNQHTRNDIIRTC